MAFDPSKPVQCRDGTPARIVCVDRKCSALPIICLILHSNGIEAVHCMNLHGRIAASVESPKDLINIPSITHKWLNVYVRADGESIMCGHFYDSVQSADFADLDDNRTTRLKFTYHDGVQFGKPEVVE